NRLRRKRPHLVVLNRRTELVSPAIIVGVPKVIQEISHCQGNVFPAGVGRKILRILVDELVFIAQASAKLEGACMSCQGIGRSNSSPKSKVDLGTVHVLHTLSRIEILGWIEDVDAVLHVKMRFERIAQIKSILNII